ASDQCVPRAGTGCQGCQFGRRHPSAAEVQSVGSKIAANPHTVLSEDHAVGMGGILPVWSPSRIRVEARKIRVDSRTEEAVFVHAEDRESTAVAADTELG